MVIKHCVYDGMPLPGLLPTPFVCWHEKEQKERRGTRGKVAVLRNRADTFFACLSMFHFCHATIVSRIADLGNVILENGHARDGNDFHLAVSRFVARNGMRP